MKKLYIYDGDDDEDDEDQVYIISNKISIFIGFFILLFK